MVGGSRTKPKPDILRIASNKNYLFQWILACEMFVVHYNYKLLCKYAICYERTNPEKNLFCFSNESRKYWFSVGWNKGENNDIQLLKKKRCFVRFQINWTFKILLLYKTVRLPAGIHECLNNKWYLLGRGLGWVVVQIISPIKLTTWIK